MQWTVPVISDTELAVHYYYAVHYCVSTPVTYSLQQCASDWIAANGTIAHSPGYSVLNYTLEGLMYNTLYDIKVVPYRTFDGLPPENGTQSEVMSAKTDCDCK